MGTIVAALIAKLFNDEFKAWFPWFTERIVRCAVRSLPENQRKRDSEEWRRYLNEIPGEIGKLVSALGFCWAGWQMFRILSGQASQLPEEPKPSAEPGRLHSLHIVFGTPVPKDDVQNNELPSTRIGS
ncbi:MAG: hypothetical protein M3P45_10585 [Acidobacteriota bacterium]|nr:hypothetical protein [Acidobacteriota bacterium]